MLCHNQLRDAIVGYYHSARLGVKVEVGSQLTLDLRQTRPAVFLVADWEKGRPAAWDVTVASPLTPAVLNEVGMTAGAAAAVSEQRQVHCQLSYTCQELDWVYVFLWLLRCMHLNTVLYITVNNTCTYKFGMKTSAISPKYFFLKDQYNNTGIMPDCLKSKNFNRTAFVC